MKSTTRRACREKSHNADGFGSVALTVAPAEIDGPQRRWGTLLRMGALLFLMGGSWGMNVAYGGGIDIQIPAHRRTVMVDPENPVIRVKGRFALVEDEHIKGIKVVVCNSKEDALKCELGHPNECDIYPDNDGGFELEEVPGALFDGSEKGVSNWLVVWVNYGKDWNRFSDVVQFYAKERSAMEDGGMEDDGMEDDGGMDDDCSEGSEEMQDSSTGYATYDE